MMIRRDFVSSPPITLVFMLHVFFAFFVVSVDAVSKEKSVGTVVRVVGDVSLIGVDGVTRNLHVQHKIYSGDRLITSKEGWVTVNFYDLTRVVLRPDSEFHVTSFPATMNAGDVDLRMMRGGARITSGIIASRARERFTLFTPNSVIHAGRAEWVVRICDGKFCDSEVKSIKQCRKYEKPAVKNTEIVSVYQGQVSIKNCAENSAVVQGSSVILNTQTHSCDVIDQVPCLVLFDGKMGKDKIRTFLKKLTLKEVSEVDVDENQLKEEVRPESRHSRPSSRTRRATPSIDRPRRNRR